MGMPSKHLILFMQINTVHLLLTSELLQSLQTSYRGQVNTPLILTKDVLSNNQLLLLSHCLFSPGKHLVLSCKLAYFDVTPLTCKQMWLEVKNMV